MKNPELDRRELILSTCAASLGFLGGQSHAENALSSRLSRTLSDTKWDVIVCGAGPAGYNAAIAAARNGARTLLIEEDANPGGAAVDYGVMSFAQGPLIEGIHREVCLELQKVDPYYDINVDDSAFLYYNLITVIRKLLAQANVSLMTNSKILGAVTKGNKVTGVEVWTPNKYRLGTTIVEGKVVIDCTGNGDIALSAGAEYRFGRESKFQYQEPFAPDKADDFVQRMTWMFVVQKYRETGKKAGWCNLGKDMNLIWGSSAICKDPTDPVSLEEAICQCWEGLDNRIKEMDDIGYRTVHVPPRPGLRESRRIIGEHVLTYHDLFNGKIFEDAVCRAKRDIDSWEPEGNPFHTYSDKCRIPLYTIPYRCLVPKKINGLLIAGRCISGTHIAMSSYRIQPIAAMIGQAAGTAAALACQQQVYPRNINIKTLQNTLRKANIKI